MSSNSLRLTLRPSAATAASADAPSIPPPPPFPWKYPIAKGVSKIIAPGTIPQIFHKFPELAPELRDKIWRYAIPIRLVPMPRTVDIGRDKYQKPEIIFMRASSAPTLIRTCREARGAYLSEAGIVRKPTYRNSFALFTFNPQSDILYITDNRVFNADHLVPCVVQWALNKQLEWLVKRTRCAAVNVNVSLYLGRTGRQNRCGAARVPRGQIVGGECDSLWWTVDWDKFKAFEKLEELLVVIDGDHFEFRYPGDGRLRYDELLVLNPHGQIRLPGSMTMIRRAQVEKIIGSLQQTLEEKQSAGDLGDLQVRFCLNKWMDPIR